MSRVLLNVCKEIIDHELTLFIDDYNYYNDFEEYLCKPHTLNEIIDYVSTLDYETINFIFYDEKDIYEIMKMHEKEIAMYCEKFSAACNFSMMEDFLQDFFHASIKEVFHKALEIDPYLNSLLQSDTKIPITLFVLHGILGMLSELSIDDIEIFQ